MTTHNLQSNPPRDGIPLNHASREFHLATPTIWALIDAGKIKASYKPLRASTQKVMRFQPRQTERRHVLVSRHGCELAAQSSTRGNDGIDCKPPPDGEPITKLAEDFDLEDSTIREWCRWPTHPCLGRKMRSGIGEYVIDVKDKPGANGKGTLRQARRRHWRGLLVSRSDVQACVDALANPLHRRFPDNPGVWIADGIFQHDDGPLCFTDKYVYENKSSFGFSSRSLSAPCYRKRLGSFKVVWPGSGPRDRWTRKVHPQNLLAALVDRRNGKADGGAWIKANDVWSDPQGTWFSSMHIAAALGIPHKSVSQEVRGRGLLTTYKSVPRHNSGELAKHGRKKGGPSVIVHHTDQANALLAWLEQKRNGKKLTPWQVVRAIKDFRPAPPAEKVQADDNGASRKKHAGGRPINPRTAAVYEFCYVEFIVKKRLRLTVFRDAQKQFGDDAPADEANVKRNARRWAQRNGLPLTR